MTGIIILLLFGFGALFLGLGIDAVRSSSKLIKQTGVVSIIAGLALIGTAINQLIN